MTNRRKPPALKLVQNKTDLEFLHDRIINRLDTREKNYICQLLRRNNNSVKTMLYPYLESFDGDIAGVLEALDSVLEVHARECYAIGVLDTLQRKKEYGIREKNLIK